MDDPRRQLDFWLGRWQCDWDGGSGRNVVEAVCDGRVVREWFRADGLVGTSISVYDEAAGRWVQTWMDSQGSWFHLTGGMRGGAFELETTTPDAEGRRKRMRFAEIADGAFEWTWAREACDGGWDQLWRIDYTRSGWARPYARASAADCIRGHKPSAVASVPLFRHMRGQGKERP